MGYKSNNLRRTPPTLRLVATTGSRWLQLHTSAGPTRQALVKISDGTASLRPKPALKRRDRNVMAGGREERREQNGEAPTCTRVTAARRLASPGC